jgi:hypothetical protein
MSTRGPASVPMTRARSQSTSVELSVTGSGESAGTVSVQTTAGSGTLPFPADDWPDLPRPPHQLFGNIYLNSVRSMLWIFQITRHVHIDQDVASMHRILWCVTAAGGRGRLQSLRSYTQGCQPERARCRWMRRCSHRGPARQNACGVLGPRKYVRVTSKERFVAGTSSDTARSRRSCRRTRRRSSIHGRWGRRRAFRATARTFASASASHKRANLSFTSILYLRAAASPSAATNVNQGVDVLLWNTLLACDQGARRQPDEELIARK